MKQLDLRQPTFDKQPPRLYLASFIAVLSIVVAIVLLLNQWQESRATKEQISQVSRQIAQIDAQTEQIRQRIANQQPLTVLQDQVASLRQEQQALSGLNQALLNVSSDQNQGFSRDLTVLAQSAMPELWLSDIEIRHQAQGKQVALSGWTTSATPMQTYIERLERLNIRSQLNVLSLQEVDSRRYRFRIASEEETQP